MRAARCLDGKDVIELGCGTAYFSAWLARRGARPVGVDVTPAQLETARQMQHESGSNSRSSRRTRRTSRWPTRRSISSSPSTARRSGVDPYSWIPEAARLLRPGGELVFLRNSTLVDPLRRPDGGTSRLASSRAASGCTASTGRTRHDRVPARPRRPVPLLRESGFDILDLSSSTAPPDAETDAYYYHSNADWAKKWPWEEIWKARKR